MVAAMTLFVSGCSIVPVPLSEDELRTQAQRDLDLIVRDQEPVAGPIDLYRAIGRALRYNLDLRLELAEKSLAQHELELSRHELLPQLISNIGYLNRDKFSGATSRSLLTGRQSLESSTSSERSVLTADLTISWNVLDFGVAYVRAQQAADEVLITEEQKRRVINRIIQDVRAAYWRAVSNERLLAEINILMTRVRVALAESKQTEIERLDTPLTALTYQRELINMKRELQELQREVSLAKIQLAALMNLRPGEEYQLVVPDRKAVHQVLAIEPSAVEQLALENRSELREVAYQQRINAKEARAAILELLPGINLEVGKNASTNGFLFHNNWLSYGTQISWNLLNAFKYPATKRAIGARDDVLDARRLALSMAILTQVHVGLARYAHARSEYVTAADYNDTQSKILVQIRAAAETNSVSEQAVIREEMNALVVEVKHDIAFADLENAMAGVFSAVGMDALPTDVDSHDVETLARDLEAYFDPLTLQ